MPRCAGGYETRLSEDGKANVPMIGQVTLRGMTADEAAAHIAERLNSGNFILNPQIDVAVIEARSRQVAVLGFVKNPGMSAQPSRAPLTLTDRTWKVIVVDTGPSTILAPSSLASAR